MPWQNFGIVKNSDFDASITLNKNIGNLKLSARGNLTYAHNEIVEYDEIPQKYEWMKIEGTSLGTWDLYISDGFYTFDDFNITGEGKDRVYELKEGIASGLSAGVKPGDIKYKDLNNDGIINQYDKVKGLGNPRTPN